MSGRSQLADFVEILLPTGEVRRGGWFLYLINRSEAGFDLLCELCVFSESRHRCDERARGSFFRIHKNCPFNQVRINRKNQNFEGFHPL